MSDETKHSPEPWTWRRGSKMDAGMNEVVVGSTGSVVCATVPQSAEADARRIVAAVNACAGIPTAALEAGALAKALDLLTEAYADYQARMPAGWVLETRSALRKIGKVIP